MRNQRSWRLLTEIEPNDTNIQVSKVIWKVDENWQPFYPLFTEETTVVIMSDDKKTFETCKATADGTGNMVLTKRWLSDDPTATEVGIFKKDWLPWTYMFATMWSWDLVSLNDNQIWNWNQQWNWNQTFDWDITITWDVNMTGDMSATIAWDVNISSTGWNLTFQDKDVWPVTLAQMIHPAWSGTELLVMSETSYEQITPTINTAYLTYNN